MNRSTFWGTGLVVGIAISASLLASGCGAGAEPNAQEEVGTVESASSLTSSLVLESTKSFIDTAGVAVTGLDDQLGTKKQGGHFLVARYNAAKTALGVRLWELKDLDDRAGAMEPIVTELQTAVSSITRVRAITLGPIQTDTGTDDAPGPRWHRVIVATREAGQLKLRAYFQSCPFISMTTPCTNTFEQKGAALATGESIVGLSVTPIFQSQDEVAPLQFATAITTPTFGQLKVITWGVDATTGAITRKSTVLAPYLVSSVAAAAPKSPWGMFTTAAINGADQSLLVTAWKVAANGTLTQQGTYQEPGTLTQISASSAGFRRTAVAFNDRGGAGTRIANFEVDAAGTVSRVDESDLGSASDDPHEVVIASGGAGRAFLVGDTWTPSTTVRSWSISGNLAQIDDAFAGAAGRQVTSATVLKADRLIAAAMTSSGGFELQAWRDFYSPLARGEWEGLGTNMPLPQDAMTETPFTPSTVPAYANPSTGSAERLIASSLRFVVSCGTGNCTFSDKAGTNLGDVSLATIFGSPNPSPNMMPILQNNLEAQYHCNPDLSVAASRCPQPESVYDTRVLYSQQVGRFVIVTALRHDGGDLNGRYLAWAVSKSEDPRDGFYTYADLESIRRDDLKATVAGGVLAIGHDGLGDAPPDDLTAASWKPAALVIDLNDLANNASFIRNTKITGTQAGSGNVHMPVHFSQPRSIYNGPNTPATVVPSDLNVFLKPSLGKLYAYWKDVTGPVTVFPTDYPLGASYSGNNSSYEALYSKEVTDGCFNAEFVRVGRSESTGDLLLQDVAMTLQRGVGFTSMFGRERKFTCPGCDRPTPAVYNGKIVVAYAQQHAGGANGFDAKYMYLSSFDATPVIGLIKQGDSSAANIKAKIPQNFLIAPDGGNDGPFFYGFWVTHMYSSSGQGAPVEMRVLPH